MNSPGTTPWRAGVRGAPRCAGTRGSERAAAARSAGSRPGGRSRAGAGARRLAPWKGVSCPATSPVVAAGGGVGCSGPSRPPRRRRRPRTRVSTVPLRAPVPSAAASSRTSPLRPCRRRRRGQGAMGSGAQVQRPAHGLPAPRHLICVDSGPRSLYLRGHAVDPPRRRRAARGVLGRGAQVHAGLHPAVAQPLRGRDARGEHGAALARRAHAAHRHRLRRLGGHRRAGRGGAGHRALPGAGDAARAWASSRCCWSPSSG